MKRIYFITSNKGKFEWAKRRMAKFGVQVVQKQLPIDEPRELAVEDVVKYKAQKAQELINEPFIIEDTSFCVDALHNFPATLIKLVQGTIGESGLIKLMEGKKNRKVNFRSALAFVKNKKIKIFICNDTGIMPKSKRGANLHGFTELLSIFIPDGFEKTAAEMSDQEFRQYERQIETKDHYHQFCKWFLKHEKKQHR
jgi:XTP/dITP diphosphohydrolase